MKKISIVIPAYNEEERIGGLLDSIKRIDYPEDCYEVIVVNDGSIDDTLDIIKKYSWVIILDLKKNVGRFDARKKGVDKAKYKHILFLDSRCEIDERILRELDHSEYKAVVGASLGVDNPNAFETFYKAIRRKVFPKIREGEIVILDEDTFDKYPKGTTVFFAKKDVLNEMYKDFAKIKVDDDTSDDTKMLNIVSKKTTLVIDPSVKVVNFARTDFRKSINHLYKRGAKFIDYYLNLRKKFFWLVIVLPMFLLITLLTFLFASTVDWQYKIRFIVILDFLVALVLAYNVRSFFKILYITPLIIIIFYLGIIRGIILKVVSAFKKL